MLIGYKVCLDTLAKELASKFPGHKISEIILDGIRGGP
jgi:hypothetical protein